MKRAVRDFLSEQVAGHRWFTAHHPDTGHVHVHAMISARDDIGKALRLTKPELYEWCERFAAKAREQGIAMVATRRADVAATRPYSQKQAGAYERGKGDPRYLKTPDVAKRVERKRDGVIDRVSLTDGSLALAPKWQATANALKRAGAQPSVIAAADRFAAAAVSGFVLLRLDVEQMVDRVTMVAIIKRAVGAEAKLISTEGKSVQVLAPTTASVSKIERELARKIDGASLGGETAAVVTDMRTRLLLNKPLFSSLPHARSALSNWRSDFNDYRPHSGLGWLAPAEFAQSINPRRNAVLRSGNGFEPQPAVTAPNTPTRNRWSELKTG